jgi:hypothetical protein
MGRGLWVLPVRFSSNSATAPPSRGLARNPASMAGWKPISKILRFFVTGTLLTVNNPDDSHLRERLSRRPNGWRNPLVWNAETAAEPFHDPPSTTMMSPLHAVAAAGNLAALERLLHERQDVNFKTILSGFTPLHLAVSGTAGDGPERRQIIRLLHQAGADLEARTNDEGCTPLHLAVLRDRPGCVAVLLDCGADVHATDAYGATALHRTALHGQDGLIDILLRAGARPDQTDTKRATPLSLARDGGQVRIVQRL